MVGPTKRASEQGPPIDLLDSLERKLSERCRESKNSLVSEQNKRHICFLEAATALIPQIEMFHI